MDWRGEYKRKLVSADEAAKVVKSGDRLTIALSLFFEPQLIGQALFARKDELRGVEILQGVVGVDFPWQQPGYEESFIVNCTQFTGPMPRQMMWDRRGDFTPVTFGLEFKDEDKRGQIEPDVNIAVVSPPDEHGYCHFGPSLWQKKEYAKRAKKNIFEVSDYVIKCHGDGFIHVSNVDYLVENTPYTPSHQEMEELMKPLFARIGQENALKFTALIFEANRPSWFLWKIKDIVSLIGEVLPFDTAYDLLARSVFAAGPIPEHIKGIAHHVNQLINDGDCIQVGTGNTSNPLVRAGVFDGKHDLGFHCEVAPPGIPQLVRDGVFTGKYKKLNTGKAVATAWMGCTSIEESEILNDNPAFETYGSQYTNDPQVIATNDNQVSINNALFVDLTGQIDSETIPGFLLYNGPGGQMDWVIGALNSKGGRSITVLPSVAVGGSISRIIPLMEQGLLVTVPRTYADFIVTEYGIASLFGKSQRRKAEELIAIAHPDFRAELKKEAQKLFWP